MKRGQFVGHIFMYLLGIIMVSFILLFGYKALAGFKDNTKTFVDIQLKDSFSSAVKNTINHGDISHKEFTIEGFREVCFVKTHNGYPLATSIPNPIIANSVNAGVEKNVFFVASDNVDSMYMGPITVDDGFFCQDIVNGKLKIKIEGFGDHVEIS